MESKETKQKKNEKKIEAERGQILGKIWGAKMYYLSVEKLGGFERWVPNKSKLVIRFYELTEERKTNVLEIKEYTGFTKEEAYIKFIEEYEHLI